MLKLDSFLQPARTKQASLLLCDEYSQVIVILMQRFKQSLQPRIRALPLEKIGLLL
jgi:hypothetical protein